MADRIIHEIYGRAPAELGSSAAAPSSCPIIILFSWSRHPECHQLGQMMAQVDPLNRFQRRMEQEAVQMLPHEGCCLRLMKLLQLTGANLRANFNRH